MSYVSKSLLPNERILATGHLHWAGYVPGALMLAFGAVLILTTGYLGWVVAIIGSVSLLVAWIKHISTELAVTDRRVIAKFGLVRRSTVELLHKNVESLQVDQNIPGRVLNFGTIKVNGTGGITTPIPGIATPLDFRKLALQAIEGSGKH